MPGTTPQIQQPGIGIRLQQLRQSLQILPLCMNCAGQIGAGLLTKLTIDRIFMAVAVAHMCFLFCLACAGAGWLFYYYNQLNIRVQYEQLS
ncbi:hypothetical protein D3C78_1242700 [compost metagenome]